MKKLVNINSPSILYVLTPPMSGLIKQIELSTGDIRYCLNRGAKVEEILADGSIVELNQDNFDKVTNPIATHKKDIKQEIEQPKVAEPVDIEAEKEVITDDTDKSEEIQEEQSKDVLLDNSNKKEKNKHNKNKY